MVTPVNKNQLGKNSKNVSGNAIDDQRLQVFLSHSGVCSRRNALELVKSGRVKVNGQVMREPSMRVSLRDSIELDGKKIETRQYQYILLNKPAGYVTTTAEHRGEQTVLDLLPPDLRHLNPVGRLDKDTEGLLLLTNDGDSAFRLTHPKFNVNKIYQVGIFGILSPQEKSKLEKGVVLEGQRTAPAEIHHLKVVDGKSEFEITIHEGRKRQIRMMCESLRHKVFFLKRLSQGPLVLGNLKMGSFRHLSASEMTSLKKLKES